MNNLQEKLLFRDSQSQVESSLGVAQSSEIGLKGEFIIPKKIHEYAIRAVDRTRDLTRECFAMFRVKSGEIEVLEEGMGPEYDFRSNEFLGDGDSWLNPKMYWRVYFERPVAVDFHTHPTLTQKYLKRKGARGGDLFGRRFSIKEICQVQNLTAGSFSESDLKRAETLNRFARTVMLGSIYGFRWIINPNLTLPRAEHNKESKQYGTALKELHDTAIKQFIAGGDIIGREEFQRHADGLLLEFCKSRSLILFGNDDYHNPKVKRI